MNEQERREYIAAGCATVKRNIAMAEMVAEGSRQAARIQARTAYEKLTGLPARDLFDDPYPGRH
jgi:hypothetical protein